MRIRPYNGWMFLAALLTVSAWRAFERSRLELADIPSRMVRWPLLTRLTTEELDQGLAHRYCAMFADLQHARDVGYFTEAPSATMWSDSSPAGASRIERYYMAQGILPPALLRLDERWPTTIVDCATPEQAQRVLVRKRLRAVRDYGNGLLLATPEH